VPLLRAPDGMRAEVVAQLAVVGEGAEGEMVPQPVVAELDLGAAPQIAGQQTLPDAGARARGGEQRRHARQHAGVAGPHLGR